MASSVASSIADATLASAMSSIAVAATSITRGSTVDEHDPTARADYHTDSKQTKPSPAFVAGMFLAALIATAVLVYAAIRLWRRFIEAKDRNRAHERELDEEAKADAQAAKDIDTADDASTMHGSVKNLEKPDAVV